MKYKVGMEICVGDKETEAFLMLTLGIKTFMWYNWLMVLIIPPHWDFFFLKNWSKFTLYANEPTNVCRVMEVLVSCMFCYLKFSQNVSYFWIKATILLFNRNTKSMNLCLNAPPSSYCYINLTQCCWNDCQAPDLIFYKI